MFDRFSHGKNIVLLFVLSYFLLLFGNNIISLTHPDEVFYIQTAKEMLAHNNWLTPLIFDQPQFEKPIFTYWLLMASIKFFGLTSFASRLTPAVFGIIGVLVTYWMAFMLFQSKRTAFLSAFILATSFIYVALSRAVLTDMVFSIWVVTALAFFYYGLTNEKKRDLSAILYFICIGFSVLTKGILGFIFPVGVVVVYLAYKKDFSYFKRLSVVWGILLALAIALPWHLLMLKWYGKDFINEYVYNVHWRRIIEAEHQKSDTWYFYLLTMFVGVFPWSLFLIPAGYFYFKFLKEGTPQKEKIIFLLSWIVVVYVTAQSAKSKLSSYIFPVFPAIAIFLGYHFHAILEGKQFAGQEKLFRVCAYVLSVFLLLASVAVAVVIQHYMGLIPDLTPIYVFSFLSLACGAMIFFATKRKKYFSTVMATACVMAATLTLLFLGKSDAEPWVSCKGISDVFKKVDQSDSVVLCSKFYVRGVRFYTDRKTAVIDINGKGFFSPHPIPFLNSDEKVSNFLASQPVTFCIVKKSNVKDLERITEGRYTITQLDEIGGKFLLKLEKI